jgi:hypothetical protein
VVLLVLVLENSRYLTVTLIERSSAGRFGPCFDAGSQQIEHEHDSPTSESGFNGSGERWPTSYQLGNAEIRAAKKFGKLTRKGISGNEKPL